MGDGEEGAEHYTDATYDNVCDAQEGVLAAHDSARRDNDRFGAAVFGYVEVCLRSALT